MAITSAVTDLIKSVGELLSSVFHAAYAIIHSFVSGIFGLLAGFFAFVGDIGQGVFDLAGGVGKFVAGMCLSPLLSVQYFCWHQLALWNSMSVLGICLEIRMTEQNRLLINTLLGNAAIIAVLAAAGYAYVRFVQQPQQGRKPAVTNGAGAKKTN
jgi:hypothetical protein